MIYINCYNKLLIQNQEEKIQDAAALFKQENCRYGGVFHFRYKAFKFYTMIPGKQSPPVTLQNKYQLLKLSGKDYFPESFLCIYSPIDFDVILTARDAASLATVSRVFP